MNFGYHPDSAIDFCVEVDVIEGLVEDCNAGLEDSRHVSERIFRAMQFRVGGDEGAVLAKSRLQKAEVLFTKCMMTGKTGKRA